MDYPHMNRDQPMSDSEVRRLTDAIRGYLIDHPNAADTLEGVVNWWLIRQRYENAMSQVSKALELLVERGELTRVKRPGSPSVYKVKKRISSRRVV